MRSSSPGVRRRSESGRVRCRGWTRRSSRFTRRRLRGTIRKAPCWRAMRSSRSPTGCSKPPRRGSRRSSSLVARCATPKFRQRLMNTDWPWCVPECDSFGTRRRRMTKMNESNVNRPPYMWALTVAAGLLGLYLLTLAPTTQFWDASEYITAAHALGIPHPPGSPLFVLLAHAWGLLPLGVDYARRINFFAAVTSAASAGCWFLVAERWLRPIVPPTWARQLTAASGTLVGATAFTVWNQSVASAKVYTVRVLSIALLLWLTVRWADQPAGGRRDNLLVLIVYLLALTATNQLMGILVAPAVLVYVLACDPRVLIRPRFLGAAALVAIVGTSVNLFLPIRAHFAPYLNEGEPTTWPALQAVLTRAQFAKPSIFDNPMYLPGPDNPGHTLALYGQQLLNYLQYFTWQYGHDWVDGVRRALAVAFAALGFLGARRHWRT